MNFASIASVLIRFSCDDLIIGIANIVRADRVPAKKFFFVYSSNLVPGAGEMKLTISKFSKY
jgi:hypothetical protein